MRRTLYSLMYPIAVTCLSFVCSPALFTSGLHAAPQEETHDYQFQGTHFIASYKECDEQALTDITALRYAVIMAAHASNAKVLSHSDFTFSGNGYTMVVLLSESHASIHTYPEHKACFIDLFTCGTSCSWEKFTESLQSYLKPKVVDSSVIERQ